MEPWWMTFGTVAGAGPYPYLHPIETKPLLVFLALLPFVILLFNFTEKRIETKENLCLWLWYAGTFLFQRVIMLLAPSTPGEVIVSARANSYFEASQMYSAKDFLGRFQEIVLLLPEHAKSNMPGKPLFFHLFGMITKNGMDLSWIIMLLSNIGGLLTYFIMKKLFKSRTAGLYAMILYFFYPSKLCFLPLMNTLNPLIILTAFLCLLEYFDSKKSFFLYALGTIVYLQLIFEPIPLILGLLFLAYLIKAKREEKLSTKEFWGVIGKVAFGFILLHLLMVVIFKFDIVTAFLHVQYMNTKFYEIHPAPSFWPYDNLQAFFQNVGLLQSLVTLGVFITALISWKKSEPSLRFLTLAFMATLLILNFSGVNRAEIVRYWIFMGVFVQMIASYWVSIRVPRFGFLVLLVVTLLQTCLTQYCVGLLQA